MVGALTCNVRVSNFCSLYSWLQLVISVTGADRAGGVQFIVKHDFKLKRIAVHQALAAIVVDDSEVSQALATLELAISLALLRFSGPGELCREVGASRSMVSCFPREPAAMRRFPSPSLLFFGFFFLFTKKLPSLPFVCRSPELSTQQTIITKEATTSPGHSETVIGTITADEIEAVRPARVANEAGRSDGKDNSNH